MQENDFRIVITQQAALEVLKISEWNEEKSRLLGNYFLDEFNSGLSKIASNPTAFARYKRTKIRRYILPDFPYKVYYITEENEIRIIDVIHNSRSKNYIRKRLE